MTAPAVSDVLAQAGAMTSVEDPRPDHFADNLAVVLRCMHEEAALTPEGLAASVGQLAGAARNRIEVDRYLAEHPEVRDGAIDAPIFMTGLPRSGTTYFQYLFDQNPALRMLRTWEGDHPVPPPAVDPDSARERRALSEETRARIREATGGKLDGVHLSDVDGPQECLAILDQTFINPGLLWTTSMAGYLRYLREDADLRAAYEHHADVLRLLQHKAPPRRWALKWPCHLLALDAIVAVHPGARFVVTHRDPVQALASNCSLARLLRTGQSPHAAPERIGQDMLDLVRSHIDGLVAFDQAQEAAGHSPFVHVDYYRLVEEPERVMPDVFAAVDLEWTGDVEDAIHRWRAENPKGRRGTHEYSLEEYGLDRDVVAAAFATYTERFAIPSEASRA